MIISIMISFHILFMIIKRNKVFCLTTIITIIRKTIINIISKGTRCFTCYMFRLILFDMSLLCIQICLFQLSAEHTVCPRTNNLLLLYAIHYHLFLVLFTISQYWANCVSNDVFRNIRIITLFLSQAEVHAHWISFSITLLVHQQL